VLGIFQIQFTFSLLFVVLKDKSKSVRKLVVFFICFFLRKSSNWLYIDGAYLYVLIA